MIYNILQIYKGVLTVYAPRQVPFPTSYSLSYQLASFLLRVWLQRYASPASSTRFDVPPKSLQEQQSFTCMRTSYILCDSFHGVLSGFVPWPEGTHFHFSLWYKTHTHMYTIFDRVEPAVRSGGPIKLYARSHKRARTAAVKIKICRKGSPPYVVPQAMSYRWGREVHRKGCCLPLPLCSL